MGRKFAVEGVAVRGVTRALVVLRRGNGLVVLERVVVS